MWKERGFLTTKGSPVVNASLIAKLLQATDLPSAIAVVHCKGHQASWDPVSHGNAQVDAAARELTAHTPPHPILFLTTDIHPAYSPQEYSTLLRQSRHPGNEGWIFLKGKIALPQEQATTLLSEIHQSLPIGPKALLKFLDSLFTHPTLSQTIEEVHSKCATCSKTSAQGRMKPQVRGHQLCGHLPGQDWQFDFTHMPPHKKFRYLFTFVDTFSGWIEAHPTTRETADTVADFLLNHIIPRFGLPSIQSDNGPGFTSQIVQHVSTSLSITWKLHIPYHPQSSGKVERANSILKTT